MQLKPAFSGIYPAVVTPLAEDDHVRFDNLKMHIRTLAAEGCQGVLLLGTTGEGPSLSLGERIEVIEHGIEAAGDMRVMAGTGCASLADTLVLTRKAFEMGVHAVVVVPPFYFKNPSLNGLLAFYRRLLDESIPEHGALFLYHIPQVTQVPISFELLEELLRYDPRRLTGIKDSSGDSAHLNELLKRFPQLCVFVGTERLLLSALKNGAAGCISAAANLIAPLDLALYSGFLRGEDVQDLQNLVTAVRGVLERYGPFPPSVKAILAGRNGTPGWEVRPPLVPLSLKERNALITDLVQMDLDSWLPWLQETYRRATAR